MNTREVQLVLELREPAGVQLNLLLKRYAMLLELHCPECFWSFCAGSETSAESILDRLIEEGPWFGLGQGDTFDEMIRTVLRRQGKLYCPECRSALSIERRQGERAGILAGCH
jgi:hypothetical protein